MGFLLSRDVQRCWQPLNLCCGGDNYVLMGLFVDLLMNREFTDSVTNCKWTLRPNISIIAFYVRFSAKIYVVAFARKSKNV